MKNHGNLHINGMTVEELRDLCQHTKEITKIETDSGEAECPFCDGTGDLEVGAEYNDSAEFPVGWLVGMQVFGSGAELEAREKFVETFTPENVDTLLRRLQEITE